MTKRALPMLTQHSDLHWGDPRWRTGHSPEREGEGEVVPLLGGSQMTLEVRVARNSRVQGAEGLGHDVGVAVHPLLDSP